jgi:hypothetical protein
VDVFGVDGGPAPHEEFGDLGDVRLGLEFEVNLDVEISESETLE